VIGVHNQEAERLIQGLIQTDLQNTPKTVGKVFDGGLRRVDYSIIRQLKEIDVAYE